MINLLSVLDVNNIWFTVFGYPMSGVEFLGTIFNLWCVWLVARGSILNWPIGLVGGVLFGFLFYQIQLYSDFLEQIYYLITGVMGWWMWSKAKKVMKDKELKIESLEKKSRFFYLGIIVIGTFIMTALIQKLNIWWPTIFLLPASYPFLDAFTTVVSFAAQWLMAKRKWESWVLWILVDVIGVWLYFVKGVVFVSGLYGVFLILAIRGLMNWVKLYGKQTKEI